MLGTGQSLKGDLLFDLGNNDHQRSDGITKYSIIALGPNLRWNKHHQKGKCLCGSTSKREVTIPPIPYRGHRAQGRLNERSEATMINKLSCRFLALLAKGAKVVIWPTRRMKRPNVQIMFWRTKQAKNLHLGEERHSRPLGPRPK